MNEKEKILTHKVLPILGVFLLVLFTMFTSCFASSELVFSDGNNYVIPDFTVDENSNYLIAYYLDTDSYDVFMYPNNYKFKKTLNGSSYSLQLYDLNNNIISEPIVHYLYFKSLSLKSDFYCVGAGLVDNAVYFSNVDIFDTDNNLVFQGAPQVEQTQLAQIVEQMNPAKNLPKEIVGVLPVVIVALVVLIAIIKAISFLKKILRNS